MLDDLNASAQALALKREGLRSFHRAPDGAGQRTDEQGEYVVYKALLLRTQKLGIDALEELLRAELARRALK